MAPTDPAAERMAERVEWAARYGSEPYAALLDALAPEQAGALERLWGRNSEAAMKIPRQLGVCPAVVYRTLSVLRRENASFNEIEKIAECDPVLATSLLSFANSALYAHSAPVRTIGAAIAYIGVDAAKRVILSAAARPVLTSIGLPDLWAHSVDVAAIAEQLAASAGAADPSEAFVAGLIHDIGRIVLEMCEAPELPAAHRKLARAANCVLAADIALLGRDHGEIGATVLDRWGMPSDLVEAVRRHHRPEGARPLAAVLCLAEAISESAESRPSPERIEAAMQTAGVRSLDVVSSDLRRLGTALAMCG